MPVAADSILIGPLQSIEFCDIFNETSTANMVPILQEASCSGMSYIMFFIKLNKQNPELNEAILNGSEFRNPAPASNIHPLLDDFCRQENISTIYATANTPYYERDLRRNQPQLIVIDGSEQHPVFDEHPGKIYKWTKTLEQPPSAYFFPISNYH